MIDIEPRRKTDNFRQPNPLKAFVPEILLEADRLRRAKELRVLGSSREEFIQEYLIASIFLYMMNKHWKFDFGTREIANPHLLFKAIAKIETSGVKGSISHLKEMLFSEQSILAAKQLRADLMIFSHWATILKRYGADFPQQNLSLTLGSIFEELLSHNWSNFSKEESAAVYTPQFIVSFMVSEVIPAGKSTFTVCDPSVGSGNFLIGAFRRMISKKVSGRTVGEILKTRLFGVDINSAAVKVTRLALYVEAAAYANVLPDLRETIKIGDSLKDFQWKKEFPKVFIRGGFDVILGNPPYIRQEELAHLKGGFRVNFDAFHPKADLYVYFIELAKRIANPKSGQIALITSNKWLRAEFGQPLRKWSLQNGLQKLVDFGDLPVFKNVAAYPAILVLTAKKHSPKTISYCQIRNLNFHSLADVVAQESAEIEKKGLDDSGWSFQTVETSKLTEKIAAKAVRLGDSLGNLAFRGAVSGLSTAFSVPREVAQKWTRRSPSAAKLLKPLITGRGLHAYAKLRPEKVLITISKEQKSIPDEILSHLAPFRKQLSERSAGDSWYQLQSCPPDEYFKAPKIIYQVFQTKPAFTIDDGGCIFNNSVWAIRSNDLFLLGYLNSPINWHFISEHCTRIRGGYQLIYKYFSKVPVPNRAKFSSILVNQIEGKVRKALDNPGQTNDLQNEINHLFYKGFGLTKSEIQLLELKALSFGEAA